MSEPTYDPTAALEAAQLDRRAFRQWKRARELELMGADAPGGLGRLWKPSKNERTLVLFTLGLIVSTLIVGTLVYAAFETNPNDSVITPLTTLAGTGLGFIGGMVSKQNANPTADTDRAAATGDAPD